MRVSKSTFLGALAKPGCAPQGSKSCVGSAAGAVQAAAGVGVEAAPRVRPGRVPGCRHPEEACHVSRVGAVRW